MALHVARDELAIVLIVVHGVGARPHQAHGAIKHIEQLGELIERPAAQDAAQGSHAGIIAAGLLQPGGGPVLGDSHGTELEHAERTPIQPVAGLGEEHRPGARSGHQQGDQQQQGRQQRQGQGRPHQIHQALNAVVDERDLLPPEVDNEGIAELFRPKLHRGVGPPGDVIDGLASVAEKKQHLFEGEIG